MKTKFYLYGWVLSSALFLASPKDVLSQCSCGTGIPVTQYSYWASPYPNPTTASTSSLQFPKFDPTQGNLHCITIKGKITSVSTTYVENTGSKPTKFSGNLLLTPRLTGPETDEGTTFLKPYGPDSLYTQHYIDSANYGSKSKTYGPDTIFNNATIIANINTNLTQFTTFPGTPVQFNYEINGGPTSSGGGTNFIFSLTTVSSGAFNLIYYACPLSPLSTNIKDFKTTIKNNNVQITWQSQNIPGNQYELQVSTDGQNYTTIYIQPTGSTGTMEQQLYNYNMAQSGSTVLYFRIKNVNASGKTTYTAISKISKDKVNSTEMGIYPNPAINNITLKFDNEIDGDLSVDIVNLTGQTIFNKMVHLNKGKSLQLDLNNPPSRGMYYVRATNKRSGTVYVNKLFMK